ncbi:MAG: hypothetical protein MUC87_00610 [Bacteroidia bacterium]|jgi:hypothetical protein|nr:hypothetical protein [Bacteroidia bacterium]
MKKIIHQSFEEYRIQTGLHRFPVSEEMLEHQRKQHESYLRYLEECNYFEPAEIDFTDTVSGNYNKSLYQLFEIERIEEGQVYVLIKHSFQPEILLIFGKDDNGYNYTCRWLESQYWARQYEKNIPEEIHIHQSVWRPDGVSGDELKRLLHTMLADARKDSKLMIILDGVVYDLFIRQNGEIKKFTKHSPPGESATGLCIAVFDEIVALACEEKNNTGDFKRALQALAEMVDG